MSSDAGSREAALEQTLLLGRIIASTLVFGVLVFATLVIVLRLGEPAAETVLVSSLAAGVAAVVVIIRQIVIGIMTGRAADARSEQTEPLALYQTRLIVGLGILEGAALFNLIAYFLEGHWWSLGIVAALVAWMMAAFPTRGRMRRWVEASEQWERLESEGHGSA
jgi:F0F1-type ATP synthase membrane subunit c/vacuolar-type H+-ATPase subunit K